VATDEASEQSSGHDEGRERLASELRALGLLALDHVDPLLARLRDAASGRAPDEPRPGSAPPGPCAACPVCTALAVVRGRHPELSERLAVHAAGMLAALRDAVDGRLDPHAAAPDPQPPRVEHIPVVRSPAGAAPPGGAPC
jgi:hypothetical protein